MLGWRVLLLNMVKMLGILLATIALTEFLWQLGMDAQGILMIYFLSVLCVSAITPHYSYGVVFSLISTFAFDFLITHPRMGFSFTLDLPVTLITMLLVTFITSTLTIQLKKQAYFSGKREHRARVLSEITQTLMFARDVSAIVKAANEYIGHHLELPCAFFLTGKQDKPELTAGEGWKESFLGRAEFEAVLSVLKGEPPQPWDETTLQVYVQQIVSRERTLGAMVIRRDGKLSVENLLFIELLARQVGLALEIQLLSDMQSELSIKAEREKMRTTLLRSISHDLRTPLTGIIGAGAAMLEKEDMPPQTRSGLLEDICNNAQWLIRMVENILTVTKISQESMQLHKTVEAAEEVISQAVSIVRGRFPRCNVRVFIPEELLLVPMDPTLISQLLINLLENAVKNSPLGGAVTVNLEKHGDTAYFEVKDNGQGIPNHILDNLFDAHPQSEGNILDSARGMGIGLSICQTIVRAHNGTIEGKNCKEGGAIFSFYLPLDGHETTDQGEV